MTFGNTARPVELAREIVIEHGWNATSYQILNHGLDLWFSAAQKAVIGYTRRSGVLLVAGAPVCDCRALEAVCDEFEHSRAGSATACDTSVRKNGSGGFSLLRVRAQLHRAPNQGVAVQWVSAASAATARQLRRILQEWLNARRLPPLHFLVETHVLDGVLTDRSILVARQRQDQWRSWSHRRLEREEGTCSNCWPDRSTPVFHPNVRRTEPSPPGEISNPPQR